MTKLDMLFNISYLMSDCEENGEYDRACIEIALTLADTPDYDFESMKSFLRLLKFGELSTTV